MTVLTLYDARNRPHPSIEPIKIYPASTLDAWNLVLAAEQIPPDHGYPITPIAGTTDEDGTVWTILDDIECFNNYWSIYGWTLTLT